MNLHSKIVVSLVLLMLATWMLSKFSQRKLSSGQVLFWLVGIVVAEVLALFPDLVDKASLLWGSLWPVSWISFAGMVVLVFYMVHQSIEINKLHARLAALTREFALLEERTRSAGTEGGDG